jgi:hypothetical protein
MENSLCRENRDKRQKKIYQRKEKKEPNLAMHDPTPSGTRDLLH